MNRTPQISIGLFGFGTVGSQVYDLIHKNKDLIAHKLGYPIHVRKICEPDPKKKEVKGAPTTIMTSKAADVLDDPEISIIVELIGDRPVAKEVMLEAMKLGKHVVTANKAILAHHGPELFKEAHANEVGIHFEAAVAGSIPIIRSIRESFVADRLLSCRGIINGTANYILTEMEEKKADFRQVVADAQKMGLAEANSSADVEGLDTAHKLILLTALCYGCFVPMDKLFVEGITQITPLDIEMASRFGYRIKLLAISRWNESEIEARVHPTMLPQNHILASVRGAFNAVMLHGERLGDSVFYGLGAGGAPTSTAVVADIVEVARNIALQIPGASPVGYRMEEMGLGKIKPMEELSMEYYLRFTALDKPNVFAKIAHALGNHNVSISSVYQHGREEGKEVPIIVITHQAREKDLGAAIQEIDKSNVVTSKTMVIRIES